MTPSPNSPLNLPALPALPDRPLRVFPPGAGVGSRLSILFWGLFLGAGSIGLVVPPLLDLVTDYGIGDQAQPVEGAKVDGKCSVHMGLLASCDATLTAPGPGGAERKRKVSYFFVDWHSGAYSVAVMADPAQPALLTTDLAIEKRWSRLLTMVTLGPLFLAVALFSLLAIGSGIGGRSATTRALSNHTLRLVPLRLEYYGPKRWGVRTVAAGMERSPDEWTVPGSARPIVLDPAKKLILGVLAADTQVAMPLDNRLRWIGLSGAERQRLLDELGPQRIDGWKATFAQSAAAAQAQDLRTRSRRLLWVALGTAALAAVAAGVTFWEPDSGAGPRVTLSIGDEGPSAGAIRLVGVKHLSLAAKTANTESGSNLASLEVWVPMTAPGWQPGEPVAWIVKDGAYGIGKDGPVTWSGEVTREPLPERARAELARVGVKLAPVVKVLSAPPPPDNPWYVPAFALMVVAGAVAFGVLLAAAIVALRARGMSAGT